ncbi:MAG: hypothetical protein RLZZ417_2321 [Bacteroidota bacterium]|jgi:hypothetical protein
MKSKSTAATLALLFGIFGLHRYYLGKKFQGILHTILFFITFLISTNNPSAEAALLLPAILGFMDAILLFVMPRQEFDEKYNARYLEFEPIHTEPRETLFDYFKSVGINKYRDLDFAGAANSFLKSVEKFGDSPQVHFNLACCYSMLSDAEMTYLHLEKAVTNGLDNVSKIHDHKALEFIRQDSKFKSFVANNYTFKTEEKITPEKEEKENEEEKLDLYGSLLKLGDLKEKGIINEEEFNLQKKKILDTL